jgi:hypothetical protein
MKHGDIIAEKVNRLSQWEIVHTPKPPLKWAIKHLQTGKLKKRSKSHIKKYYFLKEK